MGGRKGPTLAERVARSGPGAARPEPTGRHCWVVDSPGHPGRWPGLLAEWRREPAGWFGRVVYAIPDPGEAGTRLVERWIAAEHLLEVVDDRPAEAR